VRICTAEFYAPHFAKDVFQMAKDVFQMAMDLIDNFIARYRKEYNFFEQAARLAAQILEGRLRSAGIRSIVTSRAKAFESLEAKARERAPRKKYACVENIFDDIIDLAGVRIAMYFPGEHTQADSIIKSLFDLREEPKTFPDPAAQPRYKKRFLGYLATHYRVQLKESVLSDAQKRYAEARIEIQVASVLMHSWAEVEHDLVYKPQQSALSDEEYAILDELNGMVLAGEIALERLQRAGEARVAARGRLFSNHYDLASHLLSKFGPVVGRPIGDTALGRIDILYELLKRLDLGTPDKLESYIRSVNSDLEKRPLADQIIDQLISEDREKYLLYERLRASRPVPGDYVGNTREELAPEAHKEVSVFLQRWVALEKTINEKAKSKGLQRIYVSSTFLSRLGVSDEMLLKDVERIRRIRNEVVHGLSMPSSEDLRDAGSRIQEITVQLEQL
jgi:ppGpp synthetase/RelA/SpoT-type nucleotidyltranferase